MVNFWLVPPWNKNPEPSVCMLPPLWTRFARLSSASLAIATRGEVYLKRVASDGPCPTTETGVNAIVIDKCNQTEDPRWVSDRCKKVLRKWTTFLLCYDFGSNFLLCDDFGSTLGSGYMFHNGTSQKLNMYIQNYHASKTIYYCIIFVLGPKSGGKNRP